MPSRLVLVADLPWYDHPRSAAALDAFWAVARDALRAAGVREAPDALARPHSSQVLWTTPDLLLGQCCGPDLATEAGRALEVLARPVFPELAVGAGDYFSLVVGRLPLNRPPRLVINAVSSRSGCGALLEWLADRGLTAGPVTVSGSHAASLEAVRRGDADLAAIDAHAWNWLATAGLPVLGRSRAAPSPPWVVHRDCPVPRALLREVLQRAVECRGAAIGIGGVVPADRYTYLGDRPDDRLDAPLDTTNARETP